jgi:predicted ATPase
MAAQHTQTLVLDRTASSTAQFVGRQAELAFIWNQYEAAKGGRTRVVLLVGELGIGKTRLLDEVAARAVSDGATVLRGGASESEGMPPYLPFLEALGKHSRLTPIDQLREQVGATPQVLASILPELALRLGGQPGFYALPPEQARLRLYEAVGSFLEAISAAQVVVLTVDDLHWADSASLDLLRYITRHHAHARLLVLGTYREGEIDRNPALEGAVNEFVRQRGLTKIAVEPLTLEEIEALAVSYLAAPVSPATSQLLHAQSEGNPFFAEELIRGWIELGVLVQQNTQWVAVTSPLLQRLPSSIVGALRQRFSRLSQNIIDHLRIAAIIGRTFDLSLLAAVEDQEVEAVEERMLEAVRAGLVRTDQEGVFTFSHDKIRECLYTEVSSSRRRHLHETIGRILEERYDFFVRKRAT